MSFSTKVSNHMIGFVQPRFSWKLVSFTANLVRLHLNETNLHMKSFALGLALKQRRKVTRKPAIKKIKKSPWSFAHVVRQDHVNRARNADHAARTCEKFTYSIVKNNKIVWNMADTFVLGNAWGAQSYSPPPHPLSHLVFVFTRFNLVLTAFLLTDPKSLYGQTLRLHALAQRLHSRDIQLMHSKMVLFVFIQVWYIDIRSSEAMPTRLRDFYCSNHWKTSAPLQWLTPDSKHETFRDHWIPLNSESEVSLREQGQRRL